MDQDHQCYKMEQASSLVPILSDRHGTPVAFAVAAAGPNICKGLRELLPDEAWSSTALPQKAGGDVLGMAAIVQGREQCLMLLDFQRTMQGVANNGN